jgi:PAS domain S-box-containing protein
MIHAKQARKGIEDFFENLNFLMTKIAESSHIIDFDDHGKKLLDFSISSNPETVTAVTRVDERGKIIYTLPYNEKVIGKDISSQKHIQEILRNHKPVVSDIFDAVQGYPAIAMHVPIFKGSDFCGTLGVLVNFNTISKRFLDEIKIGETGYAWMTSSTGTEIYCPVPGHPGKSIYETSKNFPTLISMADEMVKGGQGVTTYMFDYVKDQQTKPIKNHAVFMPVKVVDSFWSLVVASSEEEVLVSLVNLKNKILIVAVMLLFGSIIFSYYGMKAWGIIREREERLKAEKKLKESERFLNSVVENIPNMIFVKDAKDLRFVQLNKAGEELLGYSCESLIGKNDYDFFPKEEADFFTRKDKEVLASQKLLDIPEERIQTKGDIIKFLHTKKIPIMDENGEPLFLLGISEDITDRKRAEAEKEKLEEQLRQAHKMEAVGTMAGGIAHDFNNILAIILGNAEMAKDDIPPGNPAKHNIEEVLAASNRAKDLVRQILAFSRKEQRELIPIRPQSLINETLKLLRSTTPTTVSIIQEISQDCGTIEADPTQLHQLVMNLFTNSVHAMDEKGEVAVSLQEIHLNSEEDLDQLLIMTPHAIKTPGTYAKLSITDIGIGIDKETIQRIFDPFFTTKDVGKGTGMGLSVVHGIVESHGGFMTVDSEVGKGSTFNVFFPVTEEQEVLEFETTAPLQTGTERILLVDDEVSILEMAKRMLEGLGYKVIAKSDSVEALDVFKANPDQFDLISTDQSMPDLSGAELVDEILQIRPDMPVVLCSGFSTKVSEENAKEKGISKYISKPYTKKSLASAIREVLDEKV